MIRAVVGIGVLQFASMLLLLLRTKTVALFLGTTGVGQIASFDALTAVITQTLSISLPYAALRFLPAAEERDAGQGYGLYRRMRSVLTAVLFPATVVCVVLALLVPGVFGDALVPFRRTLVLALIGLPVVGLVPFLTNAYAGLLGHTESMLLTIAHAGVMVLAAVVAAAGTGVDGFYGSYAVLGGALVWFAIRRLAKHAPVERSQEGSVRAQWSLPGPVWRFGAWLLPLTFLTPYAAWFMRYTTLRLYGVRETGILQSAIGVSLVVRSLLGAAHVVFLTPNVNRVSDPSSRMRWADEFAHATALLFTLVLPPLLMFSDLVLRILYAPQFAAAFAFVALFVAAEVVTISSGIYQTLIVAGDWMRFHVLQNLCAQGLLVLIAAVAIPRLGLPGAGVAALAAPIFIAATTLVFLRRRYGLRPAKQTSRVLAVAGGVLIVAAIVGERFPGLGLPLLSTKAALCLVLWIGATSLLSSDDRRRLRTAIDRMLARLRLLTFARRDVG